MLLMQRVIVTLEIASLNFVLFTEEHRFHEKYFRKQFTMHFRGHLPCKSKVIFSNRSFSSQILEFRIDHVHEFVLCTLSFLSFDRVLA